MRIILSPAKKMNIDTDTLEHQGLPVFLNQTKEILDWLRIQSYADLQRLWNCNDKIAEQNFINWISGTFLEKEMKDQKIEDACE